MRLAAHLSVGAVAALLLCAGPQRAWAEEEPENSRAPTERSEDSRPPEEVATTAADTANAPAPTKASGAVVDRPRPGGWLWFPRALLFIPRWAAEVVFAPPRALLWTYERFSVGDRFQRMFFNYDGTMGLFPLAFFETGFGLNVGARFVYKDLWSKGGSLGLRASYGGRFKQIYSAKATSGRLLGDRVSVDWGASFQIFTGSGFSGIGNRNLVAASTVSMPADPTQTAVATRYRHDDARVELGLVARLAERLSLRGSVTVIEREFPNEPPDNGSVMTRDVYDRALLAGATGLNNVMTDVELTYDSRRATRDYLPTAVPAAGWRLSAFAGFARGLVDRDPSRYVRYGADVQRYIDIWGGDRVLILRGHLEGVTADLESVPFLDLPHLGGPQLLRGYSRQRFRDRVAGLVSVEYMYPIQRNISGYLFADMGRVYRALDAISTDNLRVGFGGGIQLHSQRTFVMRTWIGSTSDGGFVFNIGFDPVYDHRSRKDNP